MLIVFLLLISYTVLYKLLLWKHRGMCVCVYVYAWEDPKCTSGTLTAQWKRKIVEVGQRGWLSQCLCLPGSETSASSSSHICSPSRREFTLNLDCRVLDPSIHSAGPGFLNQVRKYHCGRDDFSICVHANVHLGSWKLGSVFIKTFFLMKHEDYT